MVFGLTRKEKYEKQCVEKAKMYDLMIPHKFYVLWPRTLDSYQRVMFQYVWRYAIFYSDSHISGYGYELTEKDAWAATQRHNNVSSYCYRVIDDEIRKRLSISNATR